MPVTTATYTGAYGSGFRAWAHVSHDFMTAPSGYDVLLCWNPDEVQVSPFGANPAPTYQTADGIAVWANVNLGSTQDFELKFSCNAGFSGEALFTGLAIKVGDGAATKSEEVWSCDST